MVSTNVVFFFIAYFLELSGQDPPPSVPLGLHVACSRLHVAFSLRTMPLKI